MVILILPALYPWLSSAQSAFTLFSLLYSVSLSVFLILLVRYFNGLPTLPSVYCPHIRGRWLSLQSVSFISILSSFNNSLALNHTIISLQKKLDVIGYWSTIFAAIVLTDHFLFRKNNFDSYRIENWDKPNKLPIGIAALLSFLGGFGMVIPSMSQVWYTGPIAEAGTGDIGVLTGAVVGATLYAILRALEKKALLGR